MKAQPKLNAPWDQHATVLSPAQTSDHKTRYTQFNIEISKL